MEDIYAVYSAMPFDDKSIPKEILDINKKIKNNPLPWNGQFSPQLVEALFSSYSKKDDIVFDPFLGSGTTLLEAGEFNLEAHGTEINSGAIYLSDLYHFINVNFADRILITSKLEQKLFHHELFTKEFFGILLDSCENELELFLVRALIVLLDFYKNDFSTKWVFLKWKKVKETVLSLPFSDKKIEIRFGDARSAEFKDNVFSFVVTSPPYINVFNYHQQYRASVEFISGSVLNAARAEIGSNRQNRGNRFLTVTQYCKDMACVFSELNRVCKNNSHVIFIVGRESSVMKTPFYNGKIIAEIACTICGLKPLFRQERSFKNKFGTLIYEDILHFSSTKEKLDQEKLKRFVDLLLKASLNYSPTEKVVFLNEAIEKNSIEKINDKEVVNV